MSDRELSLKEKARICDALLKVRAIHDRSLRDLYVSELEKHLGHALVVQRYSDARADVWSLVDGCMSYPGALRSFVRIVRSVHGDSTAVLELERAVEDIAPDGALSRSQRAALESFVFQVGGQRVEAAFLAVFPPNESDHQRTWTDHHAVLREIEMVVGAGNAAAVLAFADQLAHREEGATGLDIHRWIDEVGDGFGLTQDDLRAFCVETARRLGGPEQPTVAVGVSDLLTPDHEVRLSDDKSELSGATLVIPTPVVTSVFVDKPDVRPIWGNMPSRNPEFTGREELLRELRDALLRQSKAAVLPEALHGFGGVGKTQLAVEYVYRYSNHYDVVWWISAEQSSLVRASLASLGERMQLPESQDMQQRVTTVLDALGASPWRWLLVYDNADRPEDLQGLLPSAGGHVIVTSRNQSWATDRVGHAIEVDVFERFESVELLRRWRENLSDDEANRLADKLGDLPLALEQAAIWQSATGMPVREYLELFDGHVEELMAEGKPPQYPSTVYGILGVALNRLRAEAPAAAQLFELFAYLGAEPLSATMLRNGRVSDRVSPLREALRDPIAMGRTIRELRRFGLARVDPAGQRIQVHRLIQLVLREALRYDRRQEALANVQELLALANPGDPDVPEYWPVYGEIGPHIKAADLVHSASAQARDVVLSHARYLYLIGDYEGSRVLSEFAVTEWSKPEDEGGLGREHVQTLVARGRLANALRLLGENRQALELDEHTLAAMRSHPELGEDHEHTLGVQGQVGVELRGSGEYDRARLVEEDLLSRSRRVFGEEAAHTLRATRNIAVNLRMLGDFQGAHDIDRAVVDQFQKTVGTNDVRTLFSISNLVRDIYGLGRYAEALETQLQSFALFSEMQGARHHEVLWAARTIAITLRKIGQYREALQQAKENYRAYQQRFGAEHEHTLAATMSYANTLRVVGEVQQAQSLASDAVERYARVFDARHPLTLVAQVNLAIILRMVGAHRDAYELDSQTVEVMRLVLGPRHPYTLCAETGLASDLVLQHDLAGASALSQKTLETSREVRGEQHPYTLACAVNAAFDLQANGKVNGQELFDQTIAAMRGALGEGHPEVLDANRGKRAECDIEPPPT